MKKSTVSFCLILLISAWASNLTFAHSLNDLEGTSWMLDSVEDSSYSFDSAPITLEFGAEQLGGSSGCNSYGGAYQLSVGQTTTMKGIGQITIVDGLDRTEMLCYGDGIMEAEDAYLDLLSGTFEYAILNSGALMLSNPTETLTFISDVSQSPTSTVPADASVSVTSPITMTGELFEGVVTDMDEGVVIVESSTDQTAFTIISDTVVYGTLAEGEAVTVEFNVAEDGSNRAIHILLHSEIAADIYQSDVNEGLSSVPLAVELSETAVTSTSLLILLFATLLFTIGTVVIKHD